MESTKLGKYTIHYSNSNEYHIIKREIWTENCYYFSTNNPKPYIIDIGAHIGLSVIYFKDLYPTSNIVAFEPQKESFEILKNNIEGNNLEDISLVNKAVSKEDGVKELFVDSTDSQWYSNASLLKNSWSGSEKTKSVTVETTKLDRYMDRTVDCLKIDTEGTELTILKSIKALLPKIKNVVIEYHPTKESNVKDLLNMLNPYFKTEVYSDGKLQKRIPVNKLLIVKGTQL